jgi:hypothetical protein
MRDPARGAFRTLRALHRPRLLVAVVLVVAVAVAAPVVLAKGVITLKLSDGTPAVGQQVRATITTGYRVPENDYLRLVVVAPGAEMYRVLSRVLNGKPLPRSSGWEVRMSRVGDRRFTGTVRFSKSGRWLVVVPNGTKYGYMLPPPVVREVRVTP